MHNSLYYECKTLSLHRKLWNNNMITLLELEHLITDQQNFFSGKVLIERETTIPEFPGRIIVISGIRRCGKSTLVWQSLIKRGEAMYLNFEDPRLVGFELSDFDKLEQLFKAGEYSFMVLDELQIVPGWEMYARLAHDKGIQLFVTGSNASMLSRELGTRLTGRYRQIELFPFSFNEFLAYSKSDANEGSFYEYFSSGGFPEYLQTGDPEYHRTLLRDIITRDIAVRRNISNENNLLKLAVFLMTNIGKEFSYNNMAKMLDFQSVNTVIDYCDFMHESYLFDFIPIFSYSSKKQLVNPKKAYSIDAAFAKSNSLSFSNDNGRRLENLVYSHLRRSPGALFYYRNKKNECDFVVKQNDEVTGVYQVCWEITSENMARELQGLKAAMAETGCNKGFIITSVQDDELDGIKLFPYWKWTTQKYPSQT
jgi:uncharacterized protein